MRRSLPPPSDPHHPRAGPERGQATVAVATVVVVAGLLVLALVRAGGGAVDAARARTAADAAALAGAAEGREAADRAARANDGHLVSFATEGDEVAVTVQVGERSATARAAVEGTWCQVGRSSGAGSPYTAPSCPSSPG